MSGRLGPGGLLYDYGQPLKKLTMDGASRRRAPITLADFLKLCKDRGFLASDKTPEDLEEFKAAVLAQLAKDKRAAAPPVSRAPTTVEIAVDTGEALDREQLKKLVPHFYRL